MNFCRIVEIFVLFKMYISRISHPYIYASNRLSAGASPQTPLGELIALPRPPSWFRGWDTPREGEEGGERVGGIGTPPPGTQERI